MRCIEFDRQTIGSLLIRWAWERGDAPSTMAYRMGLGWSIWARDVDRSLGECAIKRISRATGIPCDEIRAMTLAYLLQDAGLATQRNGFQTWLTPVGIYHRKRLRYGQLFCPECLRGGPGRLRMEWRLASSWICEMHGTFLRDSCPQCDAPFAPFRNDALMLARCDRCMAALGVPSRRVSVVQCELQMRVRLLWQEAVAGEGLRLAAFHEALSRAAKEHVSFRSSGEPWSYWRVGERRDLLVSVAKETFFGPSFQMQVLRTGKPRGVSKPSRRRCDSLPPDPAARAEALLRLASRVKFPRRAKARLERTA